MDLDTTGTRQSQHGEGGRVNEGKGDQNHYFSRHFTQPFKNNFIFLGKVIKISMLAGILIFKGTTLPAWKMLFKSQILASIIRCLVSKPGPSENDYGLWAEICPLATPNESQGTSKIFSKYFLYDTGWTYFMCFLSLLGKNQSLFSDSGLLLALNSHISKMSVRITK